MCVGGGGGGRGGAAVVEGGLSSDWLRCVSISSCEGIPGSLQRLHGQSQRHGGNDEAGAAGPAHRGGRVRIPGDAETADPAERNPVSGGGLQRHDHQPVRATLLGQKL